MDKAFWKNKSVLITGHTGFKGSWLVTLLANLGANVHGISNKIPTQPSMFELCKVSELLSSDTRLDINDRERLSGVYDKIKPDILIHMAAQPLVRESYLNPFETFQTNILGTINLLEAVRLSPNKLMGCLIVTTDKCYQNTDISTGCLENDSLGGKDPYAASKACTEIIAASYSESFLNSNEIPLSTARAGNVIGGGDFAKDRLIPDIVRAIESRIDIEIRNPTSVRPWQHVLEPLYGYLMLIEKMCKNSEVKGSFNFGPGEDSQKSVDLLCDYFLRNWGTDSVRRAPELSNVKFLESPVLRLNSSKANNLLGWSTKLDIYETLDWTIEWYKSSKSSLREVTEGQIQRYMDRVV